MKKKLFSLITSVCMIVCSMMFSGCLLNFDLKTTNDGVFVYHYANDTKYYTNESFNRDYYVIVDKVGELPETLYIPAYYQGKEIRRLYHYYTYGLGYGMPVYNGLSLEGVKTVYLPFMCAAYNRKDAMETLYPVITFMPCLIENYLDYKINLSENIQIYLSKLICENPTIYVTENVYNNYLLYDTTYKEGIHENWADDGRCFIKVANTSYVFNYMNAPNKGYFFINEFTYGEKIEDTPYEPLRYGYTFAGWYKEPECIHKWDFDKDALPEAKYNEQGGMIYQETKLYAKWIEA